MPSYEYVVVDKNGKQRNGAMDAADPEKLKATLKADGLIPISVKEQSILNKDINFGSKKVKPRDLSVFCRQFNSILSAGVTVISALQMLSEQTESKLLKEAVKGVQMDVEKGETLADAMRNQEEAFPSILINMVEAGEASGSLEIAFERMAVHFEKDARLKSMVKKAMVYPVVVLSVAIAVVIVMLLVVIPQFETMFSQLGSDLPGITKFVVSASEFLKIWWWLLIAIIAAIVVGIRVYKRTPNGEVLFSKMMLNLPLFGKLTIKSSSARLARTMSTLLAAGISLLDAVEITARTMTNAIVRKSLEEAREEVARGVPLSTPLAVSEVFPPMVNHMTRIGEETGNIEGMLEKIADYYDEEVEHATQALTAAMEPLIIVVLAVLVGFILFAIYTPMLSLYSAAEAIT